MSNRLERLRQREALETALEEKYGPALVTGRTLQEKTGLQRGAVIAAILTGSNACHSLADTVETGGC